MTALPFRTGWEEVRLVAASQRGLSRLERLRRLHLLAVMHEVRADPCTPERAARGRRADRIARAMREERAALLERYGELNDRCAALGMYAAVVDEHAYAEASAERDRLETLIWGGAA